MFPSCWSPIIQGDQIHPWPRSAWCSGPPGIAAARSTTPSTRRTSSRLPRRSASTAKQQRIDGPLYIGFDTHALSEPAFKSALEVLAGNAIDVMVDAENGYTPTPVISHAILSYNRGRQRGLADGIVITPSHNPPRFGGFKYDPPHGGPADTHVTAWIEERANAIISDDLRGVARIPIERARTALNRPSA